MTQSSGASGGTGLLTLLTVLFIALKLTGLIEWSWWWVLAPTWMPIVIVLPIALIGVLVLWRKE